MRKLYTAAVVAAALAALPNGVAAQNVTVEGGAAGFGGEYTRCTYIGLFGIGTVCSRTQTGGASGGYVGVSVAIPGATWLQPYVSANGFVSDVDEFRGALFQYGTNFRLGPDRWIAHPVARIGGVTGEKSAPSAGFGVYIGRRLGGLFTLDAGRRDGHNYAIAHLGGYVRF